MSRTFKDRAEPGRKIVLDKKFRSGKKSLRHLTNMLANDDFTARHLSKKLAIHFIGESVNQSEIDFIYKRVLVFFLRQPGRDS